MYAERQKELKCKPQVQPGIRILVLATDQLVMHKFLLFNKFIIFLYMFRALLCSSSGGQIVLYSIWPPDDEYKCSKHVEEYNKLI